MKFTDLFKSFYDDDLNILSRNKYYSYSHKIIKITNDYQARNGDLIKFNTQSHVITVLLPWYPHDGDAVLFQDIGGYTDLNNLIVKSPLEHHIYDSDTFVIDDNYVSFTLVYKSEFGWIVHGNAKDSDSSSLSIVSNPQFTSLKDVPSSYDTHANKFVCVNNDETGLVFKDDAEYMKKNLINAVFTTSDNKKVTIQNGEIISIEDIIT